MTVKKTKACTKKVASKRVTPKDSARTRVLNRLRKRTRSKSYAESNLLDITGYIDTGSYALNRIVSGDIYKGIPEGRIITIGGESATGKSFFAANIIRNALTKNNYDQIYYFDSEGGSLYDFLKNDPNVDMSRIEHIMIGSIEECAAEVIDVYDTLEKENRELEEANEEPLKALCILDSFGALAPSKTLRDATDKGEIITDMGNSARLKNIMMTALMIPVIKTNCSFVVLNHVYDNPGEKYTSKIKSMPGGKKLQFASHIIIQTAKKFTADDTRKKTDTGYFHGNVLKFFTTKNRIVKPFYTAEMFVDFSNGVKKYDGLLEDAKRLGFITGGVTGRYVIPSYSDKKLFQKDFMDNDEIWGTFLDAFNEVSIKEMSYGSGDPNGEPEIYEEAKGEEDDINIDD